MQLLAVDLQVKNVNHKNVHFLIKATFEWHCKHSENDAK